MRFKISADTTRESMHVSVSNTTLEVKQYSEFMKDIADQDTWDQSQSHKVMNTTVTVDVTVVAVVGPSATITGVSRL
ncbi:hypothetical protein B9Z55_000271 [Caenorhabditis nigoni]|uniref:Uncharacterized protein n=1 Tax=Caenorhabditis nigoni TaxID=1611254 RepID=A0A2G5VLT4_9PELO|nr:hypothetical protein B9Z55_000271 [Caenorhabditis nigoni]